MITAYSALTSFTIWKKLVATVVLVSLGSGLFT